MPILFVSGVNDISKIGLILDDQGRPVYFIEGNSGVYDGLSLREGVAATYLLFGQRVKQPEVEFKPQPSLIFNQIADADTHRGALERCIELCDQVNTTVINHPRHILRTTRNQVSQMLQGIPGVIMPRTQRFQPRSPAEVFSRAAAEDFTFPFVVRVAGLHDNKGMVRVDSRDDFDALHALPFDGRDMYLIQFIDYRDADGLYHKQRIAVIDGEPLLYHSLYDSDWNVRNTSREFMLEREGWEQERAYFDRINTERLPQMREAIDEITRHLQLEYYGIDCHLRADGQMIVFEVNAIQRFLHKTHEMIQYRTDAIVERIHKMLTKYSGERVI
jgi:glutathione synthase/RimK-type ligase-like ATP-grasp enzyme